MGCHVDDPSVFQCECDAYGFEDCGEDILVATACDDFGEYGFGNTTMISKNCKHLDRFTGRKHLADGPDYFFIEYEVLEPVGG